MKTNLEVRMDLSTKCNLKCAFCLSDHTRPRECSKLSEIAANIFPYTNTLWLSCGYEPLASDNFELGLTLANQYNVEKICIVTNGLLLTTANINLCTQHHVHQIGVSLETTNPEQYSQLRAGGKFSQLEYNINNLIFLRQDTPEIHYHIVVMKETLPGLRDTIQWCQYHEAQTIILQPLRQDPVPIPRFPEWTNIYYNTTDNQCYDNLLLLDVDGYIYSTPNSKHIGHI